MIGEAASAHHAWIVGALESAVRGVYQFLCRHAKMGHPGCQAAKKLYKEWDTLGEAKLPSPYGPLPAQFDRPADVKDDEGREGKEDIVGGLLESLMELEMKRLVTPVAAAA